MFLTADFDKRSQMGKRDRLAAILVRGNLGDDLRSDIACRREGMRLINRRFGDDRAVFQHVFQVHEAAVVHRLSKIVRIMKMDDAFLMRIDDILRQQESAGDVLGHFSCHIVTLRAVDGRILVRVLLLDCLIIAADQRQNLLIGGISLADQSPFIPVRNVIMGNLVCLLCHDLRFDHILDFFHGDCPGDLLAPLDNPLRDLTDLLIAHLCILYRSSICFADCILDFARIKSNFFPTALDYIHVCYPFLIPYSNSCISNYLR